MPTPVEEPTAHNASSQGRPNMIGVIAKLKMNATKFQPQIQKMPAIDRNLESLTSEETAGIQQGRGV
jgi:hypothetical protein